MQLLDHIQAARYTFDDDCYEQGARLVERTL